MARIYKVSAYLVDPNEYYNNGEDWFREVIDRSELFCPTPIEHKSSDDFEWDDNLDINCVGCTTEDCEKYFNDGKDNNDNKVYILYCIDGISGYKYVVDVYSDGDLASKEVERLDNDQVDMLRQCNKCKECINSGCDSAHKCEFYEEYESFPGELTVPAYTCGAAITDTSEFNNQYFTDEFEIVTN